MWGVGYDNKVTGTLTPNATCNYKATGWYNDQPYLRRIDGAYHIWWSIVDSAWFISVVLGTIGDAAWGRINPDPYGVYLPLGSATGNATLAMGTC